MAQGVRVPPQLAGATGTFIVKFAVGGDGSVAELHTRQPIPSSLLASIERAVTSCRFEPARDADGRATSAWILLPIRLVRAD